MNETYESGDRVAESAQCPKLVWDTYGTYETLDQAVLIAKTSQDAKGSQRAQRAHHQGREQWLHKWLSWFMSRRQSV
jgi:hypothetical protein